MHEQRERGARRHDYPELRIGTVFLQELQTPAIEVFDRGDAYDPRLDSIVRVEARRLRSKLDEYYTRSSANDAIRIDVPRGSYVATFSARSDDGQQQAAVSRRGTFALAILAVAVLLMVVSVAWRSRPAAAPQLTIAVLPFEEFSGTPDGERFAARVTDSVTFELARLGTVGVVSRTTARQFEGVRRPLREIAEALGAQIIMEGTVDVAHGGIKVTPRLVDARTDRKVWVATFNDSAENVGAIAQQIAKQAAAAATRR